MPSVSKRPIFLPHPLLECEFQRVADAIVLIASEFLACLLLVTHRCVIDKGDTGESTIQGFTGEIAHG